MTKFTTIIVCTLIAGIVLAASFSDNADYSISTTQVNSTSYVSVHTAPDTNTISRVPWSGISIANTNAATTAIVSVAWIDLGLGFTNSVAKFSIPGGTTNHVPSIFEFDNTNQHAMVKMDATLSNALHVIVYHKDTMKFTP